MHSSCCARFWYSHTCCCYPATAIAIVMHGMMLLVHCYWFADGNLFSSTYLLLIFQRDRERERDSCSIMCVPSAAGMHRSWEEEQSAPFGVHFVMKQHTRRNNQDDVILSHYQMPLIFLFSSISPPAFPCIAVDIRFCFFYGETSSHSHYLLLLMQHPISCQDVWEQKMCVQPERSYAGSGSYLFFLVASILLPSIRKRSQVQ